VVVDAVMGPIVRQAFSLYATGLYTLSALTDELNHLGLRMPETRSLPERPVSIQHVHRILRNRYYIGIITYSGIDYQGEHDPLVDETTFEMVQAILTTRNLNKDKSKKRPHPLKGNLHCARCGRRLGITAPTNRHGTTYAYFYCLGRQKDKTSCAQVYVSVAELEAAVAEYFKRVRIPEARLRVLREEIIRAFDGKHADGAAEITAQQQRIKKLNQRAKKNKEAYFADALSLEGFKLEQDKTRDEITAAEKIIAKLTVTLDAIERSLNDALSIVADPYRLFTEAPDPIKLMLTQAIFDKLWVMDHDVVGSELTDAYYELLTMKARLTLDEQATAEPAADNLSLAPAARTYYRRRTDRSEELTGQDQDEALAELAGRLWIERPQGVLPLDSRNPAPHMVRRGSDVNHLVGTTGFEPATP
jgi:site-specific DNA recombinase